MQKWYLCQHTHPSLISLYMVAHVILEKIVGTFIIGPDDQWDISIAALQHNLNFVLQQKLFHNHPSHPVVWHDEETKHFQICYVDTNLMYQA